MSKKCVKCGEVLEFTNFTVRTDRDKYSDEDQSKYSSWCKPCQSLETKLRFFGITKEEYEDLRKVHNDCCAICGIHESDARNSRTKHYGLYIDHCHSTKKVRGLLCHSCNLIIGHAQDSVSRLEASISYLKSS